MAGVLISVDMEGVAGVVHHDHTGRGGIDYGLARALMTGEANAAIEGALEAGADPVIVNDSHGTMRNLLPQELHPQAVLISGSPKPLVMMEGVDEPGVEAVLCVGYHARAAGGGVLDHTFSGAVHGVLLNGEPAGELDLNAGIAGAFDVPVVMVTGDDRIVAHAKQRLPGVETAAVKRTIHRTAARNLSPGAARDLIRIVARRGVDRRAVMRPLRYETPVTITVTWKHAGMADAASFMPGVERADAVTSTYRGDDFVEVFRAFTAMVMLAGTAA